MSIPLNVSFYLWPTSQLVADGFSMLALLSSEFSRVHNSTLLSILYNQKSSTSLGFQRKDFCRAHFLLFGKHTTSSSHPFNYIYSLLKFEAYIGIFATLVHKL
jgi:hypothetical protein